MTAPPTFSGEPIKFIRIKEVFYSNKKNSHFRGCLSVGVTGFEPATLCSQSRCATGLRYAPKMSFKFSGGERGIRTPGTVIPYDSLANCWFQPLTHLSICADKSSAFYRFCKLLTWFFSFFSRPSMNPLTLSTIFAQGLEISPSSSIADDGISARPRSSSTLFWQTKPWSISRNTLS